MCDIELFVAIQYTVFGLVAMQPLRSIFHCVSHAIGMVSLNQSNKTQTNLQNLPGTCNQSPGICGVLYPSNMELLRLLLGSRVSLVFAATQSLRLLRHPQRRAAGGGKHVAMLDRGRLGCAPRLVRSSV